MLHRFLRYLHFQPGPSVLTQKLRKDLGDMLFDALVSHRILQPSDVVFTYPCPHSALLNCGRRVEETGLDAYPYVARSSRPGFCCQNLYLTRQQVQTHRFDVPTFLRLVRRSLGIDGVMSLTRNVFPGAHLIGEMPGEPRPKEVLYCTDLTSQGGLPHVELRELRRNPTLVLCPTRHAKEAERFEMAAPRTASIEVVYLEDVLKLRDGQLVYVPMERPEPALHCFLYDGDGVRPIGIEEYQRVLAHRERYNFLVDATRYIRGGRFFTTKRCPDGTTETGSLSPHQVEALLELCQSERPLRPSELKVLKGYSHPGKLLESTRKNIDVKHSRYRWQAFHTIRDEEGRSKNKRFLFKPPHDFCYAILKPSHSIPE